MGGRRRRRRLDERLHHLPGVRRGGAPPGCRAASCSRGVTTSRPSASARSMQRSVRRRGCERAGRRGRRRRSGRARGRGRPGPSTDGVPESMRRMPSAGTWTSDIENGSAWPTQPGIGWSSTGRWRRRDVGEGGRARAAVEVLVGAADREVDPASSRCRSMAPTEWDRSHTATAPASWAAAVQRAPGRAGDRCGSRRG